MNELLFSVEETDPDLAKIMLRELPGQPLEAHPNPDPSRAQLPDQAVQRALGPGVALALRPTEDLHGQQIGLLGQQLRQEPSERLRQARPSDPPSRALLPLVDVLDRRLRCDAADAS